MEIHKSENAAKTELSALCRRETDIRILQLQNERHFLKYGAFGLSRRAVRVPAGISQLPAAADRSWLDHIRSTSASAARPGRPRSGRGECLRPVDPGYRFLHPHVCGQGSHAIQPDLG